MVATGPLPLRGRPGSVAGAAMLAIAARNLSCGAASVAILLRSKMENKRVVVALAAASMRCTATFRVAWHRHMAFSRGGVIVGCPILKRADNDEKRARNLARTLARTLQCNYIVDSLCAEKSSRQALRCNSAQCSGAAVAIAARGRTRTYT